MFKFGPPPSQYTINKGLEEDWYTVNLLVDTLRTRIPKGHKISIFLADPYSEGHHKNKISHGILFVNTTSDGFDDMEADYITVVHANNGQFYLHFEGDTSKPYTFLVSRKPTKKILRQCLMGTDNALPDREVRWEVMAAIMDVCLRDDLFDNITFMPQNDSYEV